MRLQLPTFIKEGLEEEGFDVDVADTGSEGLKLATGIKKYDLLLVDWMLPVLSGIEICKAVRKNDLDTPIIFLTAKDSIEDIVFGLNSGANDYLKKAFSFEELLARIELLLRSQQRENQTYETGDIVLNISSHSVTKSGSKFHLRKKSLLY